MKCNAFCTIERKQQGWIYKTILFRGILFTELKLSLANFKAIFIFRLIILSMRTYCRPRGYTVLLSMLSNGE